MTRREFLEQMLVNTFDVKGIEYLSAVEGVVTYTIGSTVYRDCTYSCKYKTRFKDFWKALFDSDNKEIIIKSKITKSNIEIYQNRAKEYILQIISSNAKSSVVTKENITLKATEHIYINIILEELFKIESPSKDRGNDDFSSSLEKIKNEIIGFISNNHEYANDFFNDIIEKYSIFSNLQLDEKNELVFEDIKMIREFIESSKTLPLSTFSLEFGNILSIKDETLVRNGTLASYIDKPSMEAVDFELLTLIIIELYQYSECYLQVFSEDEIETFANTAIRAYNHFYGENHAIYSGKANINHWEMHQCLIEYLFMIQFVVLSIQITYYSDKEN